MTAVKQGEGWDDIRIQGPRLSLGQARTLGQPGTRLSCGRPSSFLGPLEIISQRVKLTAPPPHKIT